MSQWRIDAEFNNYPCDESGRPFVLGGVISIEELAGAQTLYLNMGNIYNSFNETKDSMIEKVAYEKAYDASFIEEKLKEVNRFLDQFHSRFMKEADIFVSVYLQVKKEWEVDGTVN